MWKLEKGGNHVRGGGKDEKGEYFFPSFENKIINGNAVEAFMQINKPCKIAGNLKFFFFLN